MLIQTDGGLGAIFFSVKQSEKLPVIFPIPSGIAHIDETFVFDLARDFAKCRERIGRGRTLRSKLFLFRKAQRADPRENFQPRQKEPGYRCDHAPHPAIGSEIESKKRGG